MLARYLRVLKYMSWDAKARSGYDAPVIITGCARTGSTALARCLSSHPNTHILQEACVYDLEDNRLAGRRSFAWEHVPRSLNADCRPALAHVQSRRPSNEEIRTAVFDAIGRAKRLLAYGDKVPHRYLDQIIALSRRFPQARFIVTIRDGRDVVASQIRWYHRRLGERQPTEWWMRPTIARAQPVWLGAMRQWEWARGIIPEERWLEVEYARATCDPEAALRKICGFLKLPYDARALAAGLEHYWAVNVGRWREELPGLEARLSGRFRRMLRRWGYE